MTVPSDILDLSCWKLTLPVGPAEHPTEITSTALRAGYTVDPYFRLAGEGVAFRAPVNGITTSGSNYPRSELREMSPDGKSVAAWSATSGAHTLTVREAFTHLPLVKPEIVGAQIHDAVNDVTVFRLEGTKLYVTRGNVNNYALADANYVLGTRFEAKYVAYQGMIQAFYNGQLVATIACKSSGLYFKSGCYTQAHCGNSTPCSDDNYGEVTIHALAVEHADKPGTVVVTPQAPDTPPVPDQPPTPVSNIGSVVMLIRHAERPGSSGKPYGVTETGKQDSHSLTPTGWARAGALVAFFTSGRAPRPDAIYASQGSTASRRPVQTVTLLARQLGIPVVTKFDVESQIAATAAELAARAGVTLMCMEHTAIVPLLKAFPVAGPTAWPDDRFDVVICVIKTVSGWTLTQVPQRLLPGDRDIGI